MENNIYVTHEQCSEHRREICEINQEQDISIITLETKMTMVEKIMWSILGVLIAGFAGTIFSILSIG